MVDSVVRNLFNHDTIDRISDAVMAEQDKESTVIPLLERELAETEKTLNNVMAAIEQGIITDTTKRRMKELEAKKSEIETKIIREEIKERRLTKEQIVAWLTKLTELDLADEGNMTTSYKSWDAAKPHYKRLLLNMPENAKSVKVNSSPVTGAKADKSEP